MTQVTQCLWFERDMEAAIRLYVSLVPGSSITGMHSMQTEQSGGAAKNVGIAQFQIGDQRYMGIEGGSLDRFNHSFSIMVGCDEQSEIDLLWNTLKEGGSTERCGWLKDRWGVSWQIVPNILGQLMGGPDRARAKRVSAAMMAMTKFDIAELRHAAEQ